ncbi:MORF4 family-associated protein 1-like 1 [Thomomys bottae]
MKPLDLVESAEPGEVEVLEPEEDLEQFKCGCQGTGAGHKDAMSDKAEEMGQEMARMAEMLVALVWQIGKSMLS